MLKLSINLSICPNPPAEVAGKANGDKIAGALLILCYNMRAYELTIRIQAGKGRWHRCF